MKTIAALLLATVVATAARAGIEIHPAESPYQNGTQEIRVLLPDAYVTNHQYRVLYVLPVGFGGVGRPSKELKVLQEMNAHNEFNLIVVSMTFEKMPWFGDHPSDLKIRQASFLKEWVVPFVESRYSTMRGAEGRLLFGFSKSGWGAFSLVLRDPSFFGYAAAWDAPMMLPDFHYGMDQVFGTLEHLADYRPDLLALKQKAEFRIKTRLVLAGENKWGNLIPSPAGGSHTTDFHRLLEREKIKHVYLGNLNAQHTWNKEWMIPTVKALCQLGSEASNDAPGALSPRPSAIAR